MAANLPLTGYADQLSGRLGDTIDFKVSSQLNEPYQATLVRISCADPNPESPGVIEHDTRIDLGGPFPSRNQPFHPGAYAKANIGTLLNGIDQFTLTALIQPTLPDGDRQTILALGNAARSTIALAIQPNHLVLTLGNQHHALECRLNKHQWYRVTATIDRPNNLFEIYCAPHNSPDYDSAKRTLTATPDLFENLTQAQIAASWDGNPNQHFNGKIEAPQITTGADNRPLAHWDFAQEISSNNVIDIVGNCHGTLINYPARAVTGSQWNGSEMHWVHAPDQYAAIHFHEDDIYDFGWETDFSFTIPDNLASGSYAVKIESEGNKDWLPFYVCAPKAQPRKNKLCVLISTYTYAIYGNHARPYFDQEWLDNIQQKGGYPHNPAVYTNYGLSTYNNHLDGSGICHASHKRPLMNMRPGYITFPNLDCSGLRHYQADSHLLYWLEEQGIDYDVITDHELHHEGLAALKGYTALCTGTHPEYHTPQMLDTLGDYRANGGNLLYLGGNGFYWRIAMHQQDEDTLEIRRAEGGIRAWEAKVGEYYQAFDGNYGGLWRRNARPPQQIAGIGFTAQGTFHGSYYRRSKASYTDPTINWIFNGIEDEILGDFGLCGGGAAGFELDRYDPDLGSDPNIKILASSEGHGDEFTLVPEERLTHITNCAGSPESDLIRADMIYAKNKNGGKLFATGSITFCGSLLHNNSDNNISKLLKNVVQRFIDSLPF